MAVLGSAFSEGSLGVLRTIIHALVTTNQVH